MSEPPQAPQAPQDGPQAPQRPQRPQATRSGSSRTAAPEGPRTVVSVVRKYGGRMLNFRMATRSSQLIFSAATGVFILCASLFVFFFVANQYMEDQKNPPTTFTIFDYTEYGLYLPAVKFCIDQEVPFGEIQIFNAGGYKIFESDSSGWLPLYENPSTAGQPDHLHCIFQTRRRAVKSVTEYNTFHIWISIPIRLKESLSFEAMMFSLIHPDDPSLEFSHDKSYVVSEHEVYGVMNFQSINMITASPRRLDFLKKDTRWEYGVLSSSSAPLTRSQIKRRAGDLIEPNSDLQNYLKNSSNFTLYHMSVFIRFASLGVESIEEKYTIDPMQLVAVVGVVFSIGSHGMVSDAE
eukprot:TRINITY_DN438_c0_g1_i5.p1 TRINITY_DN438_c0_g1~~TRINITY_DN438_c0_g1_i5.p1  ORF type:complete len:350 (-),score=58.05 TRINITY_DN438_c0_g1_i5:486-1535(-)